jgi:outer membrane receptor protein involved in Fe transport
VSTYKQHLFNAFFDYQPFEWLTFRYRFFYQEMKTDEHFGGTWWTGQGTHTIRALWLPRHQDIDVHFLDALFEHDTSWGSHDLIVGYQRTSSAFRQTLDWGDASAIPSQTLPDGTVVDGATLLNEFNPFLYDHPDVSLARTVRNPLSEWSVTWTDAYFGQYIGSYFDDRLKIMGGVRYESENEGPNGTSHSYGFTYEVLPDINLFAGVSESWRANGPNVFLAGANSEILPSDNYVENMADEKGSGLDIGIKTDWNDGKLSGTLTFFQASRSNIRNADTRANNVDPRNTDDIPDNDVILYSLNGEEESEGMELEFVWTPIPNYQAVFSGAYVWDSGVVDNPSLVGIEREIALNRRLPQTPEWTANFWNKYTITEGSLAGFSIGVGFRYQSDALDVTGAT